MPDYLSDEERQARRYGKKVKVHNPSPTTAELVNANDDLQKRLGEQAAGSAAAPAAAKE